MRSCPRCFSPYAAELEFCGMDGTRLQICDEDPLIGRELDRFQIVALLGDGGMARVYRAKHSVLDREFAVKVLYGEIAADKKLAERFRREAQVISKLSHPNIVSVLDFGSTPDGLTFLTMELIPGRTLRSTIRKEAPIEIERAGRIARQMAAGLAAAHARGFVHRDLKPSNIMVFNDGGREAVKILDFGLVYAGEGEGEERAFLTRTGQFVGTPMYTAPEQIIGAEVTHHADLYALGVVLFEMIEGGPPFRAKTLAEIRRKHLNDLPPPLRPALGLEHLVAKLLEKDVAARPQTAEAVMAQIDACLSTGFIDDVTQRAPAPLAGGSMAEQPQLLSLPSSGRSSAKDIKAPSRAYDELPNDDDDPDARLERGEHTTRLVMRPDPSTPSREGAPSLGSASFLDGAESETVLPFPPPDAPSEGTAPELRDARLSSSIAADISIPPLSESALDGLRRAPARWVAGGAALAAALGLLGLFASGSGAREPSPNPAPSPTLITSEPQEPGALPAAAARSAPVWIDLPAGATPPEDPIDPARTHAVMLKGTSATPSVPLQAPRAQTPEPSRPRARPTAPPREVPRRPATPAVSPPSTLSIKDAEVALGKALSARGLLFEDLERDASLRPKVERWREAIRARNTQAIREQAPELERAVKTFSITGALVRERLDKISDRLNSAASTLPLVELRPLEDRYLELARIAGASNVDLEATLIRATELSRDLARAVGRR